jgi:hypothetical protein
MRRECMQAVAKALDRDLNQVEARDIEQRIVGAARMLAQQDPKAWQSMGQAQRLAAAGEQAAKQILGEAQLKAERESLQIAANTRYETYKAGALAKGVDPLEAFNRKVVFHADGKSDGLSIESLADAVRNDLMRQLIPVMEASNPKWFGLLENQEGVEAIIKELHGEDSGNPVAKAGAKIFHDVAGNARARFNASGGDIGKLDDWGMPHHHSQMLVANAANSKDPSVNRAQYVSDMMGWYNPAKYLNEDGTRMSAEQVAEFLGEAWTTIATGGANKMDPGQFKGGGMRANRGNASRQIHFKDAQSFIDYQKKYGEKSLYEVLTGHIDGIAKDIALVEEFGPNPDQAARMHRDQAVKEMILADPNSLGEIRKKEVEAENLYNFVSGRTLPVASKKWAERFDTLRNWLTASKLGGAVISSLTDEATLHLTARVNNLPAMRLLANQLATLNPANKMEERMANRAGLALNTFISSLNRFGQDNLRSGFSKKLANTVMRVQGLNAITEARRRAFGVTMMGSLGSVAREHATLGRLDPKDAALLKRKGVTEEDFRLWKAADLEDWKNGNDTMLTPDAIYRIPDEKVDQAIGASIAKVKAERQAAVDALDARNVEDRAWVANRAAKLSQWLQKEIARVDAKLAKADASAKSEIEAARKQMGTLAENIDALAESWKKPPDGDTPGVDGQQPVNFYGKGSLRRLGVEEGRAREATRNLNAQVAQVKRALESTRLAELKGSLERFRERQADLAEFTKESDSRVSKRSKVIDRITRETDPAIARMRTAAREKAATRLLGIVLEETDMAVIEPGAKERAFMGAGIQRGTWKGELMRSFFLFKSFPLAMIMRHWARGMAQEGGKGNFSKAGYLATLMASTTVLGAMSMQIKELLAGRDPRNLNPFKEHGVRNWMKAMLQGGSLGLYGDFLFSEASQYGRSPTASFLGPVVGAAEEAFNLTQGNIIQGLAGKDTHVGAESLRFVQSNLPGANLWYTKAVMDHLLWHQLAEFFSPGYLSKMRRRAEKEFGSQYWWEPGEAVPDRAPDLSAVAGE